LDVGCGAGVPVAKTLVESGFDVTGLDFSQGMLKLARENVPKARFIKEDMSALSFRKDSFDGLVAFFSIIHVPREKHSALFQGLHSVLKPNGVMLISVGSDEWEATEEYYGTKMFWSHYNPERSLQLVKGAGFQIIFDKYTLSGGEKHYWILARKKK
jgi:ubiquinone/menaquinone biosynthesis C-methylase UbiE